MLKVVCGTSVAKPPETYVPDTSAKAAQTVKLVVVANTTAQDLLDNRFNVDGVIPVTVTTSPALNELVAVQVTSLRVGEPDGRST